MTYRIQAITPDEIEAVDKLLEAANENPDAVAFAYLAGRWVAAA